eukprot:gene15754-17343_t
MISSLETLALEAFVESPEHSLACSKEPSSIHRGLNRLLKRKQNRHLRLRDDVFIPANQCENILKIILKVHGSSFLRLFHDNTKCVLKILNLANADLTDQSLLVGFLENHHLEKVVLSNAVLKAKTARKLAALSSSLKVLDLSGTSSSWKKGGAQFLKSLNNLTTLDVSFPTIGEQEECLKTISQLPCLEYLDLSGWSIRDLTPITNLSRSLKRLSLYDVCILPAVQSQLSGIFSQMTSLVHLDISQNLSNYRPQQAFGGFHENFLSDDDSTQFRYLSHDVITAIAALPKLVYLDISGCRELYTVKGLNAFGLDRLEFLGIFETGLDTADKAIPVKTMTKFMVQCWNTLWSISDEIPENSECFIENGGLEIFADCMRNFENEPCVRQAIMGLMYFEDYDKPEPDLPRAMMGLMGNIAEVDHLRSRLMNLKGVYGLFFNKLDWEKFDFEVVCQAAGVLSLITSNGERTSWLMEAIIDRVSRWDVQRSRSINYRSLKPILRLISKEDAPAAQFWAVWVLANLTGVYPEKYCELLVGENALNILRSFLASLNASEDMKRLAQMALDKITTYLGISSGL